MEENKKKIKYNRKQWYYMKNQGEKCKKHQNNKIKYFNENLSN